MKARKPIRNYHKKTGLPPGTLVYTGIHQYPTTFDAFVYDSESVNRIEADNPDKIKLPAGDAKNLWLNVNGLSNTELIALLGTQYDLHPLLLEDVLNTESMPKIDNYGDRLFISLKMLNWNSTNQCIEAEQISMLISRQMLITFQEKKGDIFDPVRERMLNGKSKIREKGIDFLAYALLDKVVDNYFLILNALEDLIEDAELDLIAAGTKITPRHLLHLKKQLILLRRYIYPLRDEVRKLPQEESALIEQKTYKYISDLYDHLQNIIQNLESFRDSVSNLMELYSNNISNKLNGIMKTLTVVGAIFIPLTFIVGVYGMNFDYMPELHFPWAYPVLMLIMLIISLGMIIYMKSRKWF
ncbi:MAG: magnesium/cobalt transporter CorA [Lentimicrobium sp.]|jgi:magnesium transporter|nr:magnesium/cobalt transporter CorA [Lentimicrobium sp.]